MAMAGVRSVPDGVHRLSSARVDAILATAFVVTGLTTTGQMDPTAKPRDGLAIALVLGATAPYYLRRRAPLAVFVVSMACIAAIFVDGYAAGALPFVAAGGAYTVAAYRPLREVLLAAAFMYAAFVVMLVGDSPGFGVAQFAASVPLFGAVMFVGWTAQARRLRVDTLEREEGEAAVRAVADERLRIAQELHDVVAHSLGVIAVQAGVGMHVIDQDPAEARRALEHISRTSRASLTEIRHLLGMVRSGEGPGYEPTPGLADLGRLAQEVGSAGLPVDLYVDPALTDVPSGVELAAYRIVQEALTNAVRHARARQATVRLDAAAGALRVVVTDDGQGKDSNAAGGGHGLVGMRERVAVYGGSLDVGPAPGGGFRVAASLPYEVG